MAVIDPCPGCGHAAGRAACQDLFNDVALRVRELAWTDSMKTWMLMHDTYCVQHEEDFCGRYKGLVVHLGGLCWGLDHGGSPTGYRALQRLIERRSWKDVPYPPAPGIPKGRGSLTAASLRDRTDPVTLASGVDRWARSVWAAYAGLQPLAREWVQDALKMK